MQTWREAAQHMQPGSRRKVQHDCGEGQALSIHRELDHAWCNCFRCGFTERINYEVPLADRIRALEERRAGDAAASTGGACLPHPLTLDPEDWPARYRAWTCRAGLSFAEQRGLGFGYHAQSDRLVLPFPGGWQARSLDSDRPKYLSSRPSPGCATFGMGVRLALVEDLLSAIRIGSPRVGELGCCLLGTSADDRALSLVVRHAQRGGQVRIWLDPDPAGQKKAGVLRRQLAALGIQAPSIVSRADPKLLNDAEILRYLEET